MKLATLLIVLSIFVVGSALAFIMSPSESAVPPTPAFSNFTIANDATVPTTSPTNITAVTYRDSIIIASDGSINITIGSYP